jgi:hypothetical protein
MEDFAHIVFGGPIDIALQGDRMAFVYASCAAPKAQLFDSQPLS